MINKVCYTYWTNGGEKYNCGFKKFDIFLSFFKISVEQSLEYFSDVVIYTDQEGYDKISGDITGATFEIIDYSSYSFDSRFWNFPKFVTYNMQNEPFIHIDCDVIFLSQPNDLEAQILTEKERGTAILKRHVYPLLPPTVKKHVDIVCSGLIGGNNYQIFKDHYDIAEAALTGREFDSVAFNDLVAIEEIALTHLIHDQNVEFKELDSSVFVHFQGGLKDTLVEEDVINLNTIVNKYMIIKDR